MPHLPNKLIELIKIKNLILPVFNEIMPLMIEYFEKHKNNEEEQKKGAFYYFCEKAYQTLNAILLLIEKGCINDAYILLRSLFEVQVTCRYIYFDIPNRLTKFLNFGWIESKRRTEKGVLKVDKEQMEKINKNYEKYKNEYKNKIYWESTKVMAENEEVKQKDDYDLVFLYCSSLLHVNPLAQQDYFIQKSVYQNTSRVLWSSLWYSLCILDNLNDIFKFGLDKKIDEIGHMIEDYGKKYVLKIEASEGQRP